jgi:DNA-binding transcriptional LysR family regulator
MAPFYNPGKWNKIVHIREQSGVAMELLAEMVTFAKVVECKSFSAAAEALLTSKSLVSKQIGALEEALGVRLLNRTTRRMSLTEIGAAYYEHCARIVHEIEAAKATVAQLQAAPRGLLRVSVVYISSSVPSGRTRATPPPSSVSFVPSVPVAS